MHPPPAPAATAPPGEQITGERDTDLSTASAQERFLVRGLGCTYPQAKALIRAYRADMERPLVTAAASHHRGFLAWLQRQPPGGLPPRVRRWRVGEGQWRLS